MFSRIIKKNKKLGKTHLFFYISVGYLKNNCMTVMQGWAKNSNQNATVLWSEYWSVPSSVDSERHQSAETAQRAEQSKRQSGSSFLPRCVVPRWYSSHEQLWDQIWLEASQVLAVHTGTSAESQRQPERRTQISDQLRHSPQLAGPVARNRQHIQVNYCLVNYCLVL